MSATNTSPSGDGVLKVTELSGRQRYRLLTSLVVPRPIGGLGTRSKAGAPNLAPFSDFNGLSASAMLVGASIGRRSEREGMEACRRDHGDVAGGGVNPPTASAPAAERRIAPF